MTRQIKATNGRNPGPFTSCLLVICFHTVLTVQPAHLHAAEVVASYKSRHIVGQSVVLTSSTGQRLRVTPYGDYIVRVQAVRKGEEFLPDDRYEMVQSHDWNSAFRLSDRGSFFRFEGHARNGAVLQIDRNPMRMAFYKKGDRQPMVREESGICWEGTKISVTLVYDDREHFTGLGHGYFGRSASIDLKGQVIGRNYGSEHGDQAPLIVPFFLSSKGYGIFLNSTFPNSFNFGEDSTYQFSLDEAGFGGRMDFFLILGPEFSHILERYTQLTGRPRLPPLAMFGLGLSDKGHDHTSPTPSDETWWKHMVTQHRNAGFPIDHLVNDNRWRAGGGKRCGSYFEWDSTRFPDPSEFETWVHTNGLVTTIDFNRCIAKLSDGWKPSFNIPVSDSIDFGDSAPDFTRKEVREWFWGLFWRKSLDPALMYPGDGLWIDEFDEMGKAPATMILGNMRSWAEMKNYWFFLIAKALVQEGWDTHIRTSKRPFVWVRGMTAGAQRYATLWSGDIRPTYEDMKTQVRSMQLAGLSGFPYWGHDAGGFYDWKNGKGPSDNMYRNWSMAFGSFTPFWKPHGMGESRWPLERSAEAQQAARRYGNLRHMLMPYTYTFAHEASASGLPMARAMVVDHQREPLAWKHDLQYMWGSEILVAPNTSDSGNVAVWLPGGTWYDFWDDTKYAGNQIISYPSPVGKLPLFVKAGALVPMVNPAPGTAFLQKEKLIIHVYVGKDATFHLYDDDGITEAYRTNREQSITNLEFNDKNMDLKIYGSVGKYSNAAQQRSYRIDYHGLSRPVCMKVNGKQLTFLDSEQKALATGDATAWDERRRILSVFIKNSPVDHNVSVKAVRDCEPVPTK